MNNTILSNNDTNGTNGTNNTDFESFHVEMKLKITKSNNNNVPNAILTKFEDFVMNTLNIDDIFVILTSTILQIKK